MSRFIKSGLVLLSMLVLSACLEVKDKSDEKVVDALTEQNKILQEQAAQAANQAAQTKTTISLTGVVNNLSTGAKAVNATVKIKVGATFGEPVAVAATSGAFQIDSLPADSNYELVVHSTTNAFLDRTYFGQTRATSSSGKIYQDLGVLDVAVGVEQKFKILNAVTNAPITSLTLVADSNVGSGSNFEQYLHKSTYDATTQEYKITVPERLNLGITAKLDLNNDGKADYRQENNNTDTLYLSGLNHDNIYLVDLNVNAKVKVKISLLDSSLQPLTSANIGVSDSLNGSIQGAYDATTKQYVIDAVIDSNLNILIPSFSVAGISYSSSNVQITRASIDETKYSLYVNSSHSYSGNFSFDATATKVFDVVVQPSRLTASSNLSVVGSSPIVDPANAIYKVFYSGAVELKSDSVSAVKRNVLHVVKGNESSTDLILPGTTLVEAVDQPIAVDSQLSLGQTLLTVSPKAPLEPGYTYNFSVGYLMDLFSSFSVDPYGDAYDVTVPSTNAFSINDIKLDNNDYYTNGAIIKPVNTAGIAANPYNYGGSYVYIYLPLSVESLKTLTLRREQITQSNTTTTSVDTYNLVSNGNINGYSKIPAISLAYNESVTGNYIYNVKTGTGIADGQWYYTSTSMYLPDNTSTSANSATFTYALETKAGVVETGTVTLPIL